MMRFRSRAPATEEPEARQAALTAGADAFVSKGDPAESLLRTLRAIAEGTY